MKYRQNKTHRRPNEYESAVVERLLEEPFPGRDELRKQFLESEVNMISDYGAKSHVTQIHFTIRSPLRAPVKSWVPVRGVAADEDGVPIDYVLHVKPEGELEGLEIVKADGTPIRRFAQASEIEVFVRPWA